MYRSLSPLLLALIAACWLSPAAAQDASAQLGSPVPALEAHSPTQAEQLERGRQAFDNGEYERTLSILRPVDPMELGRDQRVLLHEMMGKCQFILGDRDAAAEQFFEVLKLSKHHQMDEVRTPQQIQVLFEAVRLNKEKKLRRFPVEPERTIPGRTVPRVASRNMFIAFAPSGIFRLAFLGTPGIGLLLLLPQVAFIGGSVATYAWMSWYTNNNDETCLDATARNNFPAVQALNIISATLSWLIYAVGIVDAFASQRYHKAAPDGRNKRRVSSGWRWGPTAGAVPDH